MKFYNYRPLLFVVSILSLVFIYSCKEEETKLVANEISFAGQAEQTVIEGEGTGIVTATINFAAPARKDGSITITAVKQDLTYGVNYTTNPAEVSGTITVNFAKGQPSVSFTVNVIDDALNLPNGHVTFTLASITGETSRISATASTLKINIIDNEGESIILSSTEALNFGDVIPGTTTASKQVNFTTLNVVSDMTVTASTGFQVSATSDGTFATTATLPSTATSFFVRAAPAGGATLGLLNGTATISVAEVSAVTNLSTVVANAVGVLFWAENFNYAITAADGAYPPYLDTYPNINAQVNWGIIPVSAYYRATVNYNGTSGQPVVQGLQRTGHLDTWYTFNRFYGIAMGDGPLTFTGYPGSGVGRTALMKQDYSNQTSRASTAAVNPCGTEGEFASKNAQMVRRIVNNGSEITSGKVYVSAMIRVNQVFDEATPTLKNEVFMLTGDANFVNDNAMKLCIRNNGAGGFNFGVSKSGDDGPVTYGSTSYNLGTTYVVIMKVEIKPDLAGEDPNDEVSVYVYKPGDAIPTYETGTAVAEAKVDVTNQDAVNRHDVTSGLETFFFREVADVFAANNTPANVRVHEVEFSGIRVATSWSALFLSASEALYDNTPSDPLQTKNYGQIGCATVGGPQKLGNNDL
jgi:hypothetical protein